MAEVRPIGMAASRRLTGTATWHPEATLTLLEVHAQSIEPWRVTRFD